MQHQRTKLIFCLQLCFRRIRYFFEKKIIRQFLSEENALSFFLILNDFPAKRVSNVNQVLFFC